MKTFEILAYIWNIIFTKNENNFEIPHPRPTDYLLSERVFLPKASVARNWVIKNLRQIQFAIQEEQLYAECGARLKNIYLSKLLCICLSLFQKISTKKDTASTEISYQFLAPKVSVLRWNIPTNSSTSTDPFSAAAKTLRYNLFKLFWFAITFARKFAIGDNEKNKTIIKFSLSLSPSGKLPVWIWCQV